MIDQLLQDALASLPVFDTLTLYSGGGVFQIEVRGALSEGLIEASTPGFLETLGLRPYSGERHTRTCRAGEARYRPVKRYTGHRGRE